MNMFFRLLRAEWKRMVSILPGIAARAAVMVFLLGFLAVCAVQADDSLERVHPFSIGYSISEDDSLGEFAVFYVEHMDSMSGICRFVRVTPEEGDSLLKRGRIAAYIQFPEQFVEKIIDGTNEPVLIRMPEKTTVESALLMDVAKAGAKMLSVSQAEIYASYSLALQSGQPELIPQMQDDINEWNIRLALNRGELFRDRVLSATGTVGVLEYGAASVLVFCLFLMGIPCCSFLIPASDTITRSLLRAGVGKWQQVLARYLVMATVLFLFSILLLTGITVGTGSGLGLDLSVDFGSMETWTGIMMVCLCVSSIQMFCCHLASKESAAIMLVFWISLLLLFLSGGFLPSVFLPEQLRTAAGYLPGVWMLKTISALFSWNSTGENHVVLMGFSLLFVCLTVAVTYLCPGWRKKN